MPEYRRAKEPGATYFFTVVTFKRQKFLCEPESRNILRSAIKKVKGTYPFLIEAWVLLPEHLHCIWTLPEGDSDYSTRWAVIKKEFTKRITRIKTNALGNIEITNSRKKRRESRVWQRRFWEHMIRDQDDFNQHIDYIHYNPVKHSLVKEPRQWPFSTFHGFVKSGLYPEDWGAHVSETVKGMDME